MMLSSLRLSSLVRYTFLLLCSVTGVIVASESLHAQPDTLEHTLLWRIEGNGLTKPSYLYGTFHTEDARIFNFRDSVLPALLSCDAAAFEVQIDSMSTYILNRLYAPDSVLDLRDYMSEEEFAILDERVREETGLPGEALRYTDPSFLLFILDQPKEISFNDEAEEEYGYRYDYESDRKESPLLGSGTFQLPKETFLDAWLFRTARLEGKRVIPLETFEEHIAINDTIPVQERINMLVETITINGMDRLGMWREMVEAYQQEDMNRMLRLVNDEQTNPGVLFKLITERNRNMADRMATLMRRESMFTAVGTAHLPGEEGIIALLRRKGFTVTPVISGRTGVAAAYKRPVRELEWYTLNDQEKGFSVETPVPLVDFPLQQILKSELGGYQSYGFQLPKKRYRFIYDITTGLTYFIAEDNIPLETMLSQDPFLAARERWFGSTDETGLSSLLRGSSGTVMRTKEILVDSVYGKELTGIDSDGDLTRMRIFKRGAELYTFMVSGGTSVIKSKDDTRFLKSIRFFNRPTSSWQRYTNTPIPSLSTMLGAPPTPDTLRIWASSAQGKRTTLTLTSVDPATGIYYVIEQTSLSPSATVINDSLFMREMVEQGIPIDSVINESAVEHTPTTRIRRNADYTLEFASGATMLRKISIDGGKAWSFSIARPKGVSDPEGEKRFFDNTTFKPIQGSPQQQSYPQHNFSVAQLLPTLDSTDYFYYSSAKEFETGEWRGAQSYLASCKTYLTYYEAENEKKFFDDLKDAVSNAGDSIISERIVTAQGLTWHDRIVRIFGDSLNRTYRERVGLHGARLYQLRWFSLDPADNPTDADKFFATFRLLDPVPQGNIFSHKIDLLLNDLASPDSATQAQAAAAVWGYPFRQEDLPKLYEALRKEYPEPRSEYEQSVVSKLVGAFETVHDEKTTGVLRELYGELSSFDDARPKILDALATIRTDESLKIFRDLLMGDPPADTYGYAIFGSFYDSLRGIDRLYPDVLRLTENTGLRSTIVSLTNMALDSGQITLTNIDPETERLRELGLEVLKRYRTPSYMLEDEEEIYQWEAESTIALLGKLPAEKETDMLLKRTLRDTLLSIKRASAVALLRHGQEVRDKWLTEVAEDRLERLNLYRELSGAGMLDRFPKDYLSQISFAESLISENLYWSEEYPPDEIEYVADRLVEWNGRKVRGYLFKYRYWPYEEYGEGASEELTGTDGKGPWQIAFCAQPDDPNQVSADSKNVRISWQNFNPNGVDAHFRELMTMKWEE